MNEVKHTPGPWNNDGRQYIYSERSASGRMACIAKLFPGEVKGDQGIANARLIAAAPDLYRELVHLVRLLEPLERDGGLDVPGLATLNGARAAIAKAEAGEGE